MSVINSVLKDLEARETRFTPIRIDALAPTATGAGRRGPLLAAVALALLAGAAVWLLWSTPAPRGMATLVPAVEPAVLAAAALKAPPVAPRNRIVGLQLRERGDSLRLEFALRERPVAFLRHREGDRFGYHLRALDSEIEAPRIDGSDWLESLTLSARDGGIDVDFVTAPGILVETRQAQVDGEPVWAIELRRPPSALVGAIAEPSPVEPPAATVSTAAPTPAASDKPAAEIAVAANQVPVAASAAPVDTAAAEVRLDIRSTDPAAPARNRLQYAIELINAGRLADAEALLEGLLDGGEDRAARERLLALYQLSGRARDFARLARASAQRYPADAVFVAEHARVLMRSAAYAEVVELLAPAPDLDADRAALLAGAYQRLDRHVDAIRHYRRAVARDAANARHWIGLGISQEHVAAPVDALHSYRTAARLGPPSERLRAFVAKRTETLERLLH